MAPSRSASDKLKAEQAAERRREQAALEAKHQEALRKEADRKKVIQFRLEAQEQEQHNIADALHDGPIQIVQQVSKELAMLEQNVPALKDSSGKIDQAIDQLRNLCRKLQPPTLTYIGLAPAVKELAEQFKVDHPSLDIRLHLDVSHNIASKEKRTALFRVVREGLSNIIKHAQANRVDISLNVNEHQSVLVLRDDGCGFEVPQDWFELEVKRHLGLASLASRIEQFGGTLAVESAPNKGTILKVTMPIQITNP